MKKTSFKAQAPTVLVVLGATGDLISRKIIPALFHLYEHKELPRLFSVIGFARREFSDEEFRIRVKDALAAHFGKANFRLSGEFLNFFSYHQGVFENIEGYKSLARKLGYIDGNWKVCSNKLFFLAAHPSHYETIFRKLHDSDLTKPCSPKEGWTRVLAEKPFGTNLKEAKKLDLLGHRLFKEVQLYRIDHYLAKEMLQNIMMFRFSNNLFEGIWNNKFIEKIEAKINESIDIEGRGNFYDKVGALLDVGQNHLLQMLALTTMDRPKEASAEMIREKRAKIMDNLKRLANAEIKSQTVRGQYQGYLDEAGVAVGSKTETYFKIKTYLETPRWRGVPIFLEGGKKLPNVDKEIIVTFRHIAPCLCPPGQHYKNQIYFRIQPEPAIAVKFWSKIPGTAMGLEEQFLSYRYPKREGQKRYLEEYTKLILDAISGDQTLFVSSAEVMAGWRFVDPIISAWRKNAVPLEIYGRNDNILKLSRVIEES